MDCREVDCKEKSVQDSPMVGFVGMTIQVRPITWLQFCQHIFITCNHFTLQDLEQTESITILLLV